MDKYVDDFCEEYFSGFEQQGIKCCTDALFDNPRMRPFLFSRLLVIVAIAIIGASFIIPFEVSCKSNILKDLGIGILSSALVSLYFVKRDNAIQYYKCITEIIKSRISVGTKAFHAANERLKNSSRYEGMLLLQYTAKNLFGVLCYLEEKLPNLVSSSLSEGIVIEVDLEEDLSEEDVQQHIQNARRNIMKLLKQLFIARLSIQRCL